MLQIVNVKSIRKFPVLLILLHLLLISLNLPAQSSLIRNLRAGKNQVLVVYGTSLSAGAGGKAWVDSVAQALNFKYHNRLRCYNSGKSAMWSTWGVQNLEDSVIRKKPDAVIIEFGINDAFTDYNTPVTVARLNLEYMIRRIKMYNHECEVILQVMNMPLGIHADKRPDLKDYYKMYRETARKFGLLLVDHYPVWENILKKGTDIFCRYVPDGIHPSIESSRNITAPYVLKRLEEGGGK